MTFGMAEARGRGRGRGRTEPRPEHGPARVEMSDEKSEKEAKIEERMRFMRKKNEELLKRQQEIEEDKKNAGLYSDQVAKKSLQSSTEHKMAGVRRESQATGVKGRARGQILAKMTREKPKAQAFEDQRRKNFEDIEKEMKSEKEEKSPKGAQYAGSNFLADDQRVDMSKAASRSSHSWGGSQFDGVVEKIGKNKGHYRARGETNYELSMTGKERIAYQEWKEEREQIDSERRERQKKGESWKREWDQCKVEGGSRLPNQHQREETKEISGVGSGYSDWNYHDDRSSEVDRDRRVDRPKWEDNVNNTKATMPLDVDTGTEEDWEDNIDQHSSKEDGTKPESMKKTEDDWEASCTQKLKSRGSGIFPRKGVQDPLLSEDWEDTDSNPGLDKRNSSSNELDTVNKRVQQRKESDSCKLDNIGKLTITVDNNKNRQTFYVDESTCSDMKSSKPTGVAEPDRLLSNQIVQDDNDGKTSHNPKPQQLYKDKRSQRQVLPVDHKDLHESDSHTPKSVDTFVESCIQPNHQELENTKNLHECTSISKPGEVVAQKKPLKLVVTCTKPDEEEEEPIPDFLKTPKERDWADYEFEEEDVKHIHVPVAWTN